MRLKSRIFVSAIMRSEEADGAFCVVLERGAEEAGAIFILHRRGSGVADLWGPAPQTMIEEDAASRKFESLGKALSDGEATAIIGSQRRFDPDCWVIEIEKPGPLRSIETVEA